MTTNPKIVNVGEAEDDVTDVDPAALMGAGADESDQSEGEPTEGEAEVAPASNLGDNAKADKITSKAAYLAKVGTIGKQYGGGKKALVMLARTVTDGGRHKVIVASDAGKFYDHFYKESVARAEIPDIGLAPAENEKNDSADTQVSKLKAFIKFGGQWPDDAGDILDRALRIHVQLMGNKIDKESLKYTSTYAAINSVATAHLKKERIADGTPMTDEELREHFLKDGEKRVKVGRDFILAALENAEKARDGKEASEDNEAREAVESDNLNAAIKLLYDALNETPEGEEMLAARQERKDKAEAREQKKRDEAMKLVSQFRLIPALRA